MENQHALANFSLSAHHFSLQNDYLCTPYNKTYIKYEMS